MLPEYSFLPTSESLFLPGKVQWPSHIIHIYFIPCMNSLLPALIRSFIFCIPSASASSIVFFDAFTFRLTFIQTCYDTAHSLLPAPGSALHCTSAISFLRSIPLSITSYSFINLCCIIDQVFHKCIILSSSEIIQLSIYTDKYLYNLYFPFYFSDKLCVMMISNYDANIGKGGIIMAYHGVETAKISIIHRENIQYPIILNI